MDYIYADGSENMYLGSGDSIVSEWSLKVTSIDTKLISKATEPIEYLYGHTKNWVKAMDMKDDVLFTGGSDCDIIMWDTSVCHMQKFYLFLLVLKGN